MQNLKLEICRWLTVLAVAVAFGASPASAVDDVTLFELEGNAVDDSGAPLPDDWETLCNPDGAGNCQCFGDSGDCPGVAAPFTGIEADPAPMSIFTGGRKDIQFIADWAHKNGSVPDKDDITNAYAGAYTCPAGQGTKCTEGDQILYFGGDRFANVGDAFFGFWFFVDQVQADPLNGANSAGFTGEHTDLKDILVLADFPQAANAVPRLRVMLWKESCDKADNNDPQPGDCAADNLFVLRDQSGVGGALCGTIAGDHDACAITNTEGDFPPFGTVEAPWPYTAKSPDPNFPTDFPFESFFEGGINLTALLGSDVCFASFMAETRSSKRFTASLKDFVLDDFPLCAVEISKVCGTGAYNPSTMTIDVPYTVGVENLGTGLVDVVATDDNCGFGTPSPFNLQVNGNGDTDSANGTCIIPEASFNPATELLNGVCAVADSGDVPVFLADSCITDVSNVCPDGNLVCSALCTVQARGALAATKTCITRLAVDTSGSQDTVVVRVDFNGTVTNTSDVAQCNTTSGFCVQPPDQACTLDSQCDVAPVAIDNLVAVNNQPAADTPVTLSKTRLEPGDTANYSGSYFPTETNSFCPEEANFMDTVMIEGTDVVFGATVTASASDDCDLCPGDCETLP